jgi:hypothetical protein
VAHVYVAAMTVAKLIEKLQAMPGDCKVFVFSSDEDQEDEG